MLTRLADDLWEATAPMRFMGFAVGVRMVVVRLPGGGLLLHSPVPIDDALAKEIEALGVVEHIICPNDFHHVHAGPVQARYPDATLSAVAGVKKKRRDLDVQRTFDETPHDSWREAIELVTIDGCMLHETVLFHKPSGTLVTADFLEYFEHHDELLTRLYLKLGGVYGHATWNRLLRWLYRDRRAARASIDRILEWPIERVTIAHGINIEGRAKDRVAEGFSWLKA